MLSGAALASVAIGQYITLTVVNDSLIPHRFRLGGGFTALKKSQGGTVSIIRLRGGIATSHGKMTGGSVI